MLHLNVPEELKQLQEVFNLHDENTNPRHTLTFAMILLAHYHAILAQHGPAIEALPMSCPKTGAIQELEKNPNTIPSIILTTDDPTLKHSHYLSKQQQETQPPTDPAPSQFTTPTAPADPAEATFDQPVTVHPPLRTQYFNFDGSKVTE